MKQQTRKRLEGKQGRGSRENWELHYVFFIEMPWRWTKRKMRGIAEDMADEYAEANAEAHEALYDLVWDTLRAYSDHPVTVLDRT